MSTPNFGYRFFRQLQRRDGLFAADRRKGRQELFERIAGLEIVEEVVNRHARSHEDRCTAHDLGIAVNHAFRRIHEDHSTARSLRKAFPTPLPMPRDSTSFGTAATVAH